MGLQYSTSTLLAMSSGTQDKSTNTRGLVESAGLWISLCVFCIFCVHEYGCECMCKSLSAYIQLYICVCVCIHTIHCCRTKLPLVILEPWSYNKKNCALILTHPTFCMFALTTWYAYIAIRNHKLVKVHARCLVTYIHVSDL